MQPNNQRQSQRVPVSLPIKLMFGSQITLQGSIKDLSQNSAFVNVRSSAIHMASNDELNFSIEPKPDVSIVGSARISRVSVGDGIAIYFTKMDKSSITHLQSLLAV
jgi:hypothetical protein